MKKKFLILALTMSLLSLIMIPSVSATSTDSDSQTTQVSVNEDTTLTISLAGAFKSKTYSGFSAAVSNCLRSSNIVLINLNHIEVQDYTSDDGHEVDLSFDDLTWYYGGSDDGKRDLITYFTDSSPGADKVRFKVANTSIYTYWTSKDSNICTANTSTISISPAVITTVDNEIAQNTESCPGTSRYLASPIEIEGPSNGFGSGDYTQTGTFTVTDGYTP